MQNHLYGHLKQFYRQLKCASYCHLKHFHCHWKCFLLMSLLHEIIVEVVFILSLSSSGKITFLRQKRLLQRNDDEKVFPGYYLVCSINGYMFPLISYTKTILSWQWHVGSMINSVWTQFFFFFFGSLFGLYSETAYEVVDFNDMSLDFINWHVKLGKLHSIA